MVVVGVHHAGCKGMIMVTIVVVVLRVVVVAIVVADAAVAIAATIVVAMDGREVTCSMGVKSCYFFICSRRILGLTL